MNPPQTSPVPEEFKSMLHTYWSSDPIPVDSSPETSPESTAPVDIKPISNSPTKSGFSPPKEITEDWIVQQLSSPVDVVTHFEDLRKYVMNPSHEEEILPAEPLVRRKSSSRPKSFTESHVLFKVDVNTGPQEEEIPVVEEEIAVLHRQTHVRRKVNKSPEEERDEPPQEPPPEPEYKKKKKWGWLKRLFEPKRSYDDDWNPYPKDDLPVGPSRLTLEQEKVVYALSHIKLAQTGRPLEHQVMISNLMMYILSVHSDVTIRGRGPRARAKRTRMRKQPVQIVKQESESDSESSSEDEQEDNVPLGMLNIRSVGLQTAETTA
ncbi:hypothetical protein EDD86DRAFT_212642 [Gorgonomyces haynaldii]|nr:hypothetical protein EDD86DRAFT_212642 [Gorgonomyces haynaldii]